MQQYPILKQLQDAIEMKQYKTKSHLDRAKNYKEAYYMNIHTDMYTYFDVDENKYKQRREIIKINMKDVMCKPVEITSQVGLYNVMTVKLLDPHNLPTGQKIKTMQGYKLMWQLIGFRKYPDNVPCIKEFEGTVLMIGSGKMALQRSAHKIEWQKTAHGNDPYNKQILFLSKKYRVFTIT